MLRFPRLSAIRGYGRFVLARPALLPLFGALALSFAAPATADESDSVPVTEQPLKIVVSLEKQKMFVYRGTTEVFTTRVSTGKRGYSTPAGVFSILEKRRWHRSNIYSGAPMPFMQRLTWSGIALHASGHVPRYPASHGCIRLPRGSASKLFKTTDVGGHVIVTRAEIEPRPVSHPNLLQPRPLSLVTMDSQKALRDRLAFERGDRVSIALPARAYREKKVAALIRPHDETVMSDATRAAPAKPISAKEGALMMADLEYDMAALERYVARPDEPLRILITLRLGRERIRDVQTLLKDLGYDPGPIDGYMGRRTSKAIQAFQDTHGLKETGAFSEELRDRLFRLARGKPAPSGHLYVRRGFKPVFDTPVGLKNPDEPLGTHAYFALDFGPTDKRTRWLGITSEPAEGVDKLDALDRISLPKAVKARLQRALTPGSSLIISDEGLGHETGRGTDFIVTH